MNIWGQMKTQNNELRSSSIMTFQFNVIIFCFYFCNTSMVWNQITYTKLFRVFPFTSDNDSICSYLYPLNKSLIRPKTSFFNRLQPTELPTSGLAEESAVTRILFPGRTEGLRGSAKVVIHGHSPAQEELNPMVKVQRIVLPF